MTSVRDAPTFWQVARRPRWVGILAACLAVAAIFALLSQWQIARAVEQGQGDDRDTETSVPLESVAEPQQPLTSEAGGRIVDVAGTWAPDGFLVLDGRQQDGQDGSWVVGRLVVDPVVAQDASLAVAIAWFEDAGDARRAAQIAADRARAAASAPVAAEHVRGRYMPSEAPTQGDFEGGTRDAMSVAALVNEWPGFTGGVFAGYVVLDEPREGTPIVSRAPEAQTQLNWLNVFYAVEWIAFGLFAFYLWYRLVKDARERELEDAEDAAEAARGVRGPADPSPAE